MELRTYYRIIMRRWWLVVGAAALAAGLVVLNHQLRAPRYEATATIAENTAMLPVDPDVAVSSPRIRMRREERLAGLASLLETNVIMVRVIEKLKLPMAPAQLREIVTVEPVGRYSEILAISVAGRHPEKLPLIANTLANEFVVFYHGIAHGASRRKHEFLIDEAESAHEKLEETGRKLRDFRARHGVTSLEAQVPAEVAELVRLRATVQVAQVDIKRLNAVKLECEEALQGEPTMSISARTFSANPEVRTLQSQLSELEKRLAQLLATRTERHTDVIAARREMETVKGRLLQAASEELTTRSEAANPVYSLYRAKYANVVADLASAKSRLVALKGLVAQQEARSRELPEIEAAQAGLLVDQAAAEASYALLLSRRDEARLEARETMRAGPVQIVDLAERAHSTSRLPLRLAAALVLGSAIGIAVAFVVHSLDDTVYDIAQVESLLHVPVLAAIPAVRPRELPGAVGLAESYEMLRAGILHGVISPPGRMLAVASASPGAGKSTVAASLAITLADARHRVLLVDADMRRPALHRLLALDNEKGLSSVLHGDCTVAEALQSTRWPGLRVLTSGPRLGMPSRMLSSSRMRSLASSLQEFADVVIFDTPAGGLFADVFHIAAAAGAVLLVAGSGEAREGAESLFRDQLARTGARLIGSVLNKTVAERDDRYYRYYLQATANRTDGNAAAAPDRAEDRSPRAALGLLSGADDSSAVDQPQDPSSKGPGESESSGDAP